MKSPDSELAVLLRKISWIAMGVVGFGVLVGAVVLALDAPPSDTPPAMASSKDGKRTGRKLRKSRYVTPMRSKYKLPMAPTSRGRRPPKVGPRAGSRAVPMRAERPDILRSTAMAIGRVKRPGLAPRGRTGRLSKEELEERRVERRKRQVERLRKRIQTLEDRIENYKQDGTRTEAQISRMERSLDRMRKRLKRMEDQQQNR